ncbi:MAG: DUF3037 domain-containing protein [bacterium]|nr:DUF3037 domain-containing protein [bacterium]
MSKPFVAFPLRYYPNLATGEFLNVGVGLSSLDNDFVGARVATKLRAFSSVFRSAQPKSLQRVLKKIDLRLRKLPTPGSSAELFVPPPSEPIERLRKMVGDLPGSLRWSNQPIEGSTDSYDEELDYWFDKLVHIAHHKDARIDEDGPEYSLYKVLRGELLRRGILQQFKKETVGSYAKETFELTVRNGRLNVFNAINLDLKKPAGIIQQARQWRGRLDVASDDEADLAFFALTDLPVEPALRSDALVAIEIIRHAGVAHVEMVPRDEVERLGEIAEEALKH